MLGNLNREVAAEMVCTGVPLLPQIRLKVRRLELRYYSVGSYIVRRKTLQGIFSR